MSFLNDLIKEANKVPVIADKNAPMLLMIAGIGGLAATVISAVKATPLAIDKMDDEIAWRIMFGDLKAMSVKDISNTYGLSRGQVYSVRGYYTFTHLKADEMPESLVEKYEAAEAVAQ